MKRQSQQGVALIITLIMLSIITVVTITFLALSRRERASVSQTQNLTDAETAAQSALERAEAEIQAQLFASSNVAMTVSRTFDPTNRPYSALDRLQFDPRVPVFVETNRNGTAGPLDFRFFLDLNRNGFFETNDFYLTVDWRGTNAVFFQGDPEWIGVLEYPGEPHSRTNRFTVRYAYLIQPAGQALDLNWIHNQAKRLGPAIDGFMRNQSVGTWEVNLAAFLHDLDPNVWNYSYNSIPGAPSSGNAFGDAAQLLRFRYGGDYRSLASMNALFGPNAAVFQSDGVDQYADGPLASFVFGTNPPPVVIENDNLNEPWAGSDGTNHFFDLSRDLFDPTKVSPGFVTDLQAAIRNNGYAYYDLLSQLTTDSTPDGDDKINLNYDNTLAGEVAAGTATNLVPWTSTNFFLQVANRLLLDEFNFGATNIEIYPTNFYTPGVHRLLQEAANLYDATANRSGLNPDLPTIFRPLFTKGQGNRIFISGYDEVKDLSVTVPTNWKDLEDPAQRNSIGSGANDYVYGIPLIVGAKKGYPNFNEFTLQTSVQISRKVEIRKPTFGAKPNGTNQMYILGVSNVFGIEAWNSYSASFPRNLEIRVANRMTTTLTDQGGNPLLAKTTAYGTNVAVTAGSWIGNEFKIPMFRSDLFLSNSIYRAFPTPHFQPLTLYPNFEPGFPLPEWVLGVTNRVLYFLIDRSANRLVDVVSFDDFETQIDLTKELIISTPLNQGSDIDSLVWRNQRSGGPGSPTEGIINQIGVGMGTLESSGDWTSYSSQGLSGRSKELAIDGFRVFLGKNPLYNSPTNQLISTNLTMQVPFTPTRKIYAITSWQANDPLVHYMADDMRDWTNNTILQPVKPIYLPVTNWNLGRLNDRYRPWGGNPNKNANSDPNAYLRSVKDPLVFKSDDWNFPQSKFPNIGWIGRVHRGTPWQTIYLKSEAPTPREWARQSLDLLTNPTNDWRLVDMLSASVDPQATLGRLSVNQSGLQAWSAVFGSLRVLSNALPNDVLNSVTNLGPRFNDQIFIQPGSPQLIALVDGINRTRAQTPTAVFRSLGEFLAVPELSAASPFLNLTPQQVQMGINDLAYEWIPQHILPLIKVGEPRFVIYAFGQSLQPAEKSIVTSGPAFGVCTNYQVTGEVATRTVLRMDGNHPVVEQYNVLPPP